MASDSQTGAAASVPPTTDEKLARVRKLREKGNTFFGSADYAKAAAKYSAAGALLAIISSESGLTAEQLELRDDELVSTNLNAAVCKLRLDQPTEAIEMASAVLELRPTESKALFRIGQAHAALANHAEAKKYLLQAEEAAAGDEERVHAIRQERARLAARVEKQKREQKEVYSKMMHEGKPPPPPPSEMVRRWRKWKETFARLLRRYPVGMRVGLQGGLLVGGLGTARIVTGEPVTIPILMMVAGPIMFGLQYLHPVVEGRSKEREETYQKAKSKKDFEDGHDKYWKEREVRDRKKWLEDPEPRLPGKYLKD